MLIKLLTHSRRKNEEKIILGICIVLLLFCAIETASAKTWYVDDSGGRILRRFKMRWMRRVAKTR